jgi:2-keto-4-pentenoate hydratase
VSNGAFVRGAPQPRWRDFDLVTIEASLIVDDDVVVQRNGGHPAGDPLKPAVELVNALRSEGGVRAGQVMTTGTYTGLTFVKPGQTVTAAFDGFGSARVHLD